MPNKIDQLAAERDALLAQLQSIDRLRRGSFSRQVYSKQRAGVARAQGPYFVLQGFHKGKKFSQRVPAAQAGQVGQQVQNFKRFQDLADQCITVTDQMTRLAEAKSDGKKTSAGGSPSRALPGNRSLPEAGASGFCPPGGGQSGGGRIGLAPGVVEGWAAVAGRVAQSGRGELERQGQPSGRKMPSQAP